MNICSNKICVQQTPRIYNAEIMFHILRFSLSYKLNKKIYCLLLKKHFFAKFEMYLSCYRLAVFLLTRYINVCYKNTHYIKIYYSLVYRCIHNIKIFTIIINI